VSLGVTRISGSFTATGQSASAVVFGPFNAVLWGTPLSGTGVSGTFSGTVQIERSMDGGTTWVVVSTDGTGTQAIYTSPVSVAGMEPENGVLYRFDCTIYTSGTINYRLSQVGDIGMALVRHV
jgi:hypothetical protein